jgi:fluoride exporter
MSQSGTRHLPVHRGGLWAERFGPIAAVSIGGFLGANARFAISLWAEANWGAAFPWGTLLVNLVGSFVLGFYLTLASERFSGRAITRLSVATGFLGSFTTFSTFSYEVVRLITDGALVTALIYVVSSLVLGLAALVVGIASAHVT